MGFESRGLTTKSDAAAFPELNEKGEAQGQLFTLVGGDGKNAIQSEAAGRPSPWAQDLPWNRRMPRGTEAGSENQLLPRQDVRPRVELSELVRKVQDAVKEPLDNALSGSQYEKNLVSGMANGIIAGDMAGFRYNLQELYHGLGVQGRGAQEKTEIVRDDLRTLERVLRQNCGVDISLDLTNDDRAIIRMRPDLLAIEVSKDGDRVRRIEESSGAVILDNTKEVIRPTVAELARTISDRATHGRQW